MKYYLILIASFLFLSCSEEKINSPVTETGNLKVINITIKTEHYTELLENKLLEASVPAKFDFNNKTYRVQLSPQGAGSRFYPKFGLKVTCPDDNIRGLREFILSAQVSDNTFIRTALSTYLYKQLDFPTFYSEVVFVRINNEDKGLFLLAEKVDEDYFTRRNEKVYELMKTVFDAKFTFDDKNNPEATFEKKIPDDKNYSNLSDFIYTLDRTDFKNNSEELEKHLDVTNYIKYHLITSVMNNTDGLANNFYFYKKEGSSPYLIIPWDFDKSFNLKFSIGVCGDNHIIRKILQNPHYKNYYNQLLEIVAENYFTEENLFPIIDSCYTLIKPFYDRDRYLYNSNESFEERISKLKTFISNQRLLIKQSSVN